MSNKIVLLPDGRIPEAKGPDESVVDLVERLLEDAREGRLVGLAFAAVLERGQNVSVRTGWSGRAARADTAYGVMVLHGRVQAACVADAEENG